MNVEFTRSDDPADRAVSENGAPPAAEAASPRQEGARLRAVRSVPDPIEVRLIDDLDGSDATETIVFRFGRDTYEIDLSAPNAAALRAVFDDYIPSARPMVTRLRRRTNRPPR